MVMSVFNNKKSSTILTDEEKRRLDELLADDSDLLMVDNPFTNNNAVGAHVGFQFSEDEQTALRNIDAQLKEFIPSEEYSITVGEDASFDDSLSTHSKMTTCTEGMESMYLRANCGEQVLQEGGDERRDVCRLRDIEARLKHLQTIEDMEESEGSVCGGRLDPDMLRRLLDVDSRLTSDSVSICESLRSKSSTVVYDVDDVEIVDGISCE